MKRHLLTIVACLTLLAPLSAEAAPECKPKRECPPPPPEPEPEPAPAPPPGSCSPLVGWGDPAKPFVNCAHKSVAWARYVTGL